MSSRPRSRATSAPRSASSPTVSSRTKPARAASTSRSRPRPRRARLPRSAGRLPRPGAGPGPLRRAPRASAHPPPEGCRSPWPRVANGRSRTGGGACSLRTSFVSRRCRWPDACASSLGGGTAARRGRRRHRLQRRGRLRTCSFPVAPPPARPPSCRGAGAARADRPTGAARADSATPGRSTGLTQGCRRRSPLAG